MRGVCALCPGHRVLNCFSTAFQRVWSGVDPPLLSLSLCSVKIIGERVYRVRVSSEDKMIIRGVSSCCFYSTHVPNGVANDAPKLLMKVQSVLYEKLKDKAIQNPRIPWK
jgi:hypothetical protein